MHKETLLLLSRVVWVLACWSGQSEDDSREGMLNSQNPSNFNGWSPPPGAKLTWDEWLKNWAANTASKGGHLTQEQINAGILPEGHNIADWPDDWHDLQAGFSGMAPPPWAYVPKNMGKPSNCNLPKEFGTCKEQLTRYGYNPYIHECVQFEYSGCGGNYNNFLTQISCERACINPTIGCDTESDIPLGDLRRFDHRRMFLVRHLSESKRI